MGCGSSSVSEDTVPSVQEYREEWDRFCQPSVFNFGRYEGDWMSEGFHFELAIDEMDFKPIPGFPFAFDSRLQWRLISADSEEYDGALNKQGAELIRGYYFNSDLKGKAEETGYSISNESDWNRFMCVGYEVMEDETATPFLGIAAYDLHLNPPGSMISKMIETKTLSYAHRWEDALFVRRVASYRELRVLLDDWLNEPNITGVISSLLHHFEQPTRVSEFERETMSWMLPVCDTRLPPLFKELSYYKVCPKMQRRDSENETAFYARLDLVRQQQAIDELMSHRRQTNG